MATLIEGDEPQSFASIASIIQTASFEPDPLTNESLISNELDLAIFSEGTEVMKFVSTAVALGIPQLLSTEIGGSTYLGEGRCSCVQKSTVRGRTVALKMILKSVDTSDHEVDSEIRLLRKDLEILSHPVLSAHENFPRIQGYSVGIDASSPMLAIEFADKGTLESVSYGDVHWEMRLKLLIDVAEGLRALHSSGICHGDIKKGNILVFTLPNNDLLAKVSDFSHSIYETPISKTGERYTGTKRYAAIEVWKNSEEIDPLKCDIWALGLLIWKLVAYREESLDDILSQWEFVGNNGYEEFWRTCLEYIGVSISGCKTCPESSRACLRMLIYSCLHENPLERPGIVSILSILRSTQSIPPKQLEDEEPAVQELTTVDRVWGKLEQKIPIWNFIGVFLPWKIKQQILLRITTAARNEQSEHKLILPILRAIGYGCMSNDEDFLTEGQNDNGEGLNWSKPSNSGTPLDYSSSTMIQVLDLLRLSTMEPFMPTISRVLVSKLAQKTEHSLLHIAAYMGDLGIVKLLIEHHFADPTSLDGKKRNPLWYACRAGNSEVALCLAPISDCSNRDSELGATPLHWLWKMREDDIEVIAEVLIQNGADVNQTSLLDMGGAIPYCNGPLIFSGSPLHWAISAGSDSAVRALLAWRGDSLRTVKGISPLQLAARLFRHQLLDSLLPSREQGVSGLDFGNLFDAVVESLVLAIPPSPLEHIIHLYLYGQELKSHMSTTLDFIIRTLSLMKVQSLKRDLIAKAITAPKESAVFISLDLIEQLVEFEKEKNQPLDRTFIIKLIYQWHNHGEKCGAILDSILSKYRSQVDLNVVGSDKRTPLHEAAIQNAYPLIKLLVRHGANIEAADIDGSTPLGLAAHMASSEAFDELIDNGANIYQPTSGMNVIHNATMPETRISLVSYILRGSRHSRLFQQRHIVDSIDSGTLMPPLAKSISLVDRDAINALSLAGANPRAPVIIQTLEIAISVREFAKLIRLDSEIALRLGIHSNFRSAQARDRVLKNYTEGGAYNRREEDFDDRPFRKWLVRETRPDEPTQIKWISIDISRHPIYGAIDPNNPLWYEKDILFPEEDILGFFYYNQNKAKVYTRNTWKYILSLN